MSGIRLKQKHEREVWRIIKEDRDNINRPIQKTRELANIYYQYIQKIESPIDSRIWIQTVEKRIMSCARCRAAIWKWFINYFKAKKIRENAEKATAKGK